MTRAVRLYLYARSSDFSFVNYGQVQDSLVLHPSSNSLYLWPRFAFVVLGLRENRAEQWEYVTVKSESRPGLLCSSSATVIYFSSGSKYPRIRVHGADVLCFALWSCIRRIICLWLLLRRK